MIRERKGNTNAKDRYDGMFNATEGDIYESIVKAITQYAEIATGAQSKMSEMEIDLYQLKMEIQNPYAA